MELLAAYRALIVSPTPPADCTHAGSVADLLRHLKRLWRCEHLGDDALVAQLNRCNQQVLDIDPAQMAGRWFPIGYRARDRSLHWCLPVGHATQPFQDQYIEACLQSRPINQLIRPRTTIAPLVEGPERIAGPAPTGFIFHLSRCGSTLVAGCLAELDDTSLLSEPPLLTDLLLDASLTDAQKRQALPQLIRLQAAPFPGRDRAIVKWNAWDLFAEPLIRVACPGVPRLLLFRDPEEILASHARSPGRHMAGDPSLAHLHPAFVARADADMLAGRLRVLDALMSAMARSAEAPGSWLLDYAQLDRSRLAGICRHFGLAPDAEALARMAARAERHSKHPGEVFEADAARKRQWFAAADRQRIHAAMAAPLASLRAATPAWHPGSGPA